MTGKTIKKDIVHEMVNTTKDLHKSQIIHIIQILIDTIIKELIEGNSVKIDNFGVFKTRWRSGIYSEQNKQPYWIVSFVPYDAAIMDLNNNYADSISLEDWEISQQKLHIRKCP